MTVRLGHLEIFPRRLAEARNRLGISQAELGRRAGMDPGVAGVRLNQYERGIHMPAVSVMRRLAEVLNVPIAYFFAEDELLARTILCWQDFTVQERLALVNDLESRTRGSDGTSSS